MNITIKETKELDYEKVVDIFFEVGFLKNEQKRKEYSAAIEKGFRNSQLVVSAWDEEELIGFARVLTDSALFATVWNMLVRHKYQKRGVGALLLKKCVDSYPACHFFLFAGKKTTGFYKKNGFAIHQYGMSLKDGFKRCVIYS